MYESTDIDTLKKIIDIVASTCKELRHSISRYCKIENKTHRTDVLMKLIRRIERNLYATAVLANVSIQHKHKIYLKLPIGLILRNCFIDVIYAIFFKTLTDNEFEKEISVLNKNYVKSFEYRKPVYIGKLKESGIENFEDFGDLMYSLSIEDTFTQYLSFETLPDTDGMWPCISDKEIRKEYTKDKQVRTIDQIYKYLKSDTADADLLDAVYANYKYFSQYEHFSEYSHGDSLAPFGEDNVSFPYALKVIRESTSFFIEKNV